MGDVGVIVSHYHMPRHNAYHIHITVFPFTPEHGAPREVERADAELLEGQLRDLGALRGRRPRGDGVEEGRALRRVRHGDLPERVLPDGLHRVPVPHVPVLEGEAQLCKSGLGWGLGLVSFGLVFAFITLRQQLYTRSINTPNQRARTSRSVRRRPRFASPSTCLGPPLPLPPPPSSLSTSIPSLAAAAFFPAGDPFPPLSPPTTWPTACRVDWVEWGGSW